MPLFKYQNRLTSWMFRNRYSDKKAGYETGKNIYYSKNCIVSPSSTKTYALNNSLLIGGIGPEYEHIACTNLIPSSKNSYIVVSKGHNMLNMTGSAFENAGDYNIKILNLEDKQLTHKYNPMCYIEEDLIPFTAETLAKTMLGDSSDYLPAAEKLLVSVMYHIKDVMHQEEAGKFLDVAFGNCGSVIEKQKKIFEDMMMLSSKRARDMYASFLETAAGNDAVIYAAVERGIRNLKRYGVLDLFAEDEMEIEKLNGFVNPYIVFVVLPESRNERYKQEETVASLFLTQMLYSAEKTRAKENGEWTDADYSDRHRLHVYAPSSTLAFSDIVCDSMLRFSASGISCMVQIDMKSMLEYSYRARRRDFSGNFSKIVESCDASIFLDEGALAVASRIPRYSKLKWPETKDEKHKYIVYICDDIIPFYDTIYMPDSAQYQLMFGHDAEMKMVSDWKQKINVEKFNAQNDVSSKVKEQIHRAIYADTGEDEKLKESVENAFARPEVMEDIEKRKAERAEKDRAVQQMRDRQRSARQRTEKANEERNAGKRAQWVKKANPVRIKEFLDRTIVGQDDAKKCLSVAMTNHMLAFMDEKRQNHYEPETTLIMGPTGSGKTMIVKALAGYSGLPVVVADASQLTADGWKGTNKGDILMNLFPDGGTKFMRGEEKPENIYLAEHGIVMLDEFDKFASSSKNGGYGYAIKDQNAILGMLDGTPVMIGHEDDSRQFNTDRLLFILTGAFIELDDNDAHAPLGFNSSDDSEKEEDDEKIRQKLTDHGMVKELVGRITTITSTKALTEDEIYKAVIGPDAGILKNYARLYSNADVRIFYNEEYIRGIIRKGMEDDLGVRGIKSVISEIIREKLYRMYETGGNRLYIGDDSDTVSIDAGFVSDVDETGNTDLHPGGNDNHREQRRETEPE